MIISDRYYYLDYNYGNWILEYRLSGMVPQSNHTHFMITRNDCHNVIYPYAGNLFEIIAVVIKEQNILMDTSFNYIIRLPRLRTISSQGAMSHYSLQILWYFIRFGGQLHSYICKP